MPKFDWIVGVVAMTIFGYESMSLISGVAESLSSRRQPRIDGSRLESKSQFGITRISEVKYLLDTPANWPLHEYCGADCLEPRNAREQERRSGLGALLLIPALVSAVGEAAPVGQPIAFSPALFARLETKDLQRRARWSWPEATSFEQTWKSAQNTLAPVRVVIGTISRSGAREIRAALAIHYSPDGFTLGVLATGLDDDEESLESEIGYKPWTLLEGSFDGRPFTLVRSSSETLRVTPASITQTAFQPDARSLADWTYVTTLMATATSIYEPLERDRREYEKLNADGLNALWMTAQSNMTEGKPEAVANLRDLLTRASRVDPRWYEAAEWAEKSGHDELAREIYRRFHPVGSCSHDSRPAEAARRYAELCYRDGLLGCFLQLQVQIMGDQFDRFAYSGLGELVHSTEAEKLAESGLDVDRFLRGLVLRYEPLDPKESRPRELDAWRLARSIREAGRSPALDPELARMAGESSLDDYNRFRATITLAFVRLQASANRSRATRSRIALQLEGIGLNEPSRMWLESFASAD
jgi:hypothetical protein